MYKDSGVERLKKTLEFIREHKSADECLNILPILRSLDSDKDKEVIALLYASLFVTVNNTNAVEHIIYRAGRSNISKWIASDYPEKIFAGKSLYNKLPKINLRLIDIISRIRAVKFLIEEYGSVASLIERNKNIHPSEVIFNAIFVNESIDRDRAMFGIDIALTILGKGDESVYINTTNLKMSKYVKPPVNYKLFGIIKDVSGRRDIYDVVDETLKLFGKDKDLYYPIFMLNSWLTVFKEAGYILSL